MLVCKWRKALGLFTVLDSIITDPSTSTGHTTQDMFLSQTGLSSHSLQNSLVSLGAVVYCWYQRIIFFQELHVFIKDEQGLTNIIPHFLCTPAFLFLYCQPSTHTHTHTCPTSPGPNLNMSSKLVALAFLATFLQAAVHSAPECRQSDLRLYCHRDPFQPAKEQRTE